MPEELEENIVVKSILNKFLEDVTADKNIPSSLVAKIESLRNDNKLSKGNHLKSLLTAIDDEEVNNEV